MGRASRSVKLGLRLKVAPFTTGPTRSVLDSHPCNVERYWFRDLNSQGRKSFTRDRNNIFIELEIETTILDSPCYMTSRLKEKETIVS